MISNISIPRAFSKLSTTFTRFRPLMSCIRNRLLDCKETQALTLPCGLRQTALKHCSAPTFLQNFPSRRTQRCQPPPHGHLPPSSGTKGLQHGRTGGTGRAWNTAGTCMRVPAAPGGDSRDVGKMGELRILQRKSHGGGRRLLRSLQQRNAQEVGQNPVTRATAPLLSFNIQCYLIAAGYPRPFLCSGM